MEDSSSQNESRPAEPRRRRYRPKLSALTDVRWIVPASGGVLGIVFGYVVSRESGALAGVFRGAAWVTSVSEARSILTGLVAIEATVLGIVMSLILLALQNATNQYSARLLRLYLTDPVTLIVQAIVACSATYFLTTLVALGLSGAQAAAPRPSLSLAILLFALAGAAIAVDIAHTLQLIRLEVIVCMITSKTIEAADAFEARGLRLPLGEPGDYIVSPTAVPIPAPDSGYVVDVKADDLLRRARQERVSIRIDASIGDFVALQSPMGWVEPLEQTRQISGRTIDRIAASVHIDSWRLSRYDVALGVRQLVDIAIKALSPAVNDPYTAVEAVGQLTVILAHLAHLHLGDRILCDNGTPCVSIHCPSLRDYLVLATDQISRYGAAEPAVTLSLLALVRDVGTAAKQPEDKNAAITVGRRILSDAESATANPERLAAIRRAAAEAESWITTGPTAGTPWPINL